MPKKLKKSYLKYFVIGSFLLLLLVAYKLYAQGNKTPKTEMDCLNLGSNERTKLCLQLLQQKKTSQNFPINNLSIENLKGEDTGFCVQLSGTIFNSSSQIATQIQLKSDFSEQKNDLSFHYEVFTPFQTSSEQIQPNSRKSFSTCLNVQTYNAVKNIKQWRFSVMPYSAKIYNP